MLVLPLIAALTLAQADTSRPDPLRPEETTAPPRADVESTPEPEVGFGGAEEEEPGTGGSGTANAALEEENARLREELQRMRTQLELANETATQTQASVEELTETYEAREDEKAAALAESAEEQRERTSALMTARNLLVRLRPDVIYDSTSYATALDTARGEIDRAVELGRDEATVAAQSAVFEAREAFAQRDMHRMWRHAQAAILQLERAATLPPAP